MGSAWSAIRSHRSATYLFLGAILAMWIVTLATWQFDEQGTTLGMSPLAVLLQLLVPLAAGLLVGRWLREDRSDRSTVLDGLVAGGLVGLVTLVIAMSGSLLAWLLVYHLILGVSLAGESSLLDGVIGFGVAIVLMGLLGFVIGAVGGLIGSALSRPSHRAARES